MPVFRVRLESKSKRFHRPDSSNMVGGFYFPEDGRSNPVDATMSLAKGARDNGVRIFEDCEVVSIKKKNGCAVGVTTKRGEEISAEYIVNCAGMWGRKIGAMAGVDIPLHATEHYYLITEPIKSVTDLPILEDVDTYSYFRMERRSVMSARARMDSHWVARWHCPLSKMMSRLTTNTSGIANLRSK